VIAIPTPTGTQVQVMQIIAAWSDEEVRRLVASGLSEAEAGRVHNRQLRRARVLALMSRLINEVGA